MIDFRFLRSCIAERLKLLFVARCASYFFCENGVVRMLKGAPRKQDEVTRSVRYPEVDGVQKGREILAVLQGFAATSNVFPPMPAPPGSPLIYVDNLEASMDNEALYDTFRLFGGVLTCKVACDEDGKSKRSGVVHFESADSAQEASERVGGMQIGERAVVVKQLSNAEAKEYLQRPSLKAHLTLRGENLR